MSPHPKTIFMLAGEPSGDRLGADIMRALTSKFGKLRWCGMGGPDMQACGLNSSEDMSQLSIIGIGAALASIIRLNKLADRLIAQIDSQRPDYIFTVDSKGFSVRFATRLRRYLANGTYQPRIIHVVAPTIWAWGAWRKRNFETAFDAMLCLFPFEPELFDTDKLALAYMGHPVGWHRQRPIPDSPVQIALLPGSRASEIRHLLPLFLQAAQIVHTERPDIRFSLPILPHLAQMVADISASFQALPLTIDSASDAVEQVLSSSHIMLAGSGTVTLEAAVAGVPGVTAYHMPFFTRIISSFLFKPHTPILPDILLGTSHYPFIFPPRLNADALASALIDTLDDYSQRQTQMFDASDALRYLLAKKASYDDQLAFALDEIF
ncbi:MAG: lipid-A-disaccharide synthase [Candidatus Puniceispirillaceae bacterium]